jgi:acyl-CoA thioester hydrolase
MNPHPSSTHRYSMRVYYEDTDAGGIVYHASYLRFAERARTEALRDQGVPHAALLERHNLMFVVHRAEIDYLLPARLDESLIVETETLDVAAASMLLRQRVIGTRGVCAALRIKLACVRIAGNRPARIPPEWRVALAAMRDQAAQAAQTGD